MEKRKQFLSQKHKILLLDFKGNQVESNWQFFIVFKAIVLF